MVQGQTRGRVEGGRRAGRGDCDGVGGPTRPHLPFPPPQSHFDAVTAGAPLPPYDGPGRRAGSKTGGVRSAADRAAVAAPPAAGRRAASRPAPAAKENRPVAGGGKAAAAADPLLPSSSDRDGALAAARTRAAVAERERDFYFDKLRDVELLCQAPGLAGAPVRDGRRLGAARRLALSAPHPTPPSPLRRSSSWSGCCTRRTRRRPRPCCARRASRPTARRSTPRRRRACDTILFLPLFPSEKLTVAVGDTEGGGPPFSSPSFFLTRRRHRCLARCCPPPGSRRTACPCWPTSTGC